MSAEADDSRAKTMSKAKRVMLESSAVARAIPVTAVVVVSDYHCGLGIIPRIPRSAMMSRNRTV